MSEKKVATEVAEQEFARFIEAMDLDVEPNGWSDDDKKSFEDTKRKIIRAMERGDLVITEDGIPQFTPKLGNREPIMFREPTGATLMAIDQAKKGANVSAAFKMLAEQTQTSADRFAKMQSRDLKVCQALQALFLA